MTHPKGFSTDSFKALAADVDDTAGTMYFQHIYRTNYSGTWRQHACLKMGYWCWRNALSRPQDILPFLRKKRYNKSIK